MRYYASMMESNADPSLAYPAPARRLALIQGAYFLLTGLWPLIDIESFQWVTGPKTDLWLVRTVAVLITAIGAMLLRAGWRRHVSLDAAITAAGSAAGLAIIDLVYALHRTISPIYLLDAVVEIFLVAYWITCLSLERPFRSGSLPVTMTSATASSTDRMDCRFVAHRATRDQR